MTRAGSTHWRRVLTPRGIRVELGPFRLSRHFTDPEARLETMRHEIAHAAALLLDGERGHGPVWQRHAVLCGAHPRACTAARPAKAPKVVLACSGCGQEAWYYRPTTRVALAARLRCRKCRTVGFHVTRNAYAEATQSA